MSNALSDRRIQIGLVAHDARKEAMINWVREHRASMANMSIYSTGTTGRVLSEACPELEITRLKSGPLGGDQQLGAMICEERLDALVFFVDPLSPMPHDVDVKALTRLAIVYDLPMACSVASANLVLAGMRKSDAS